MTIYNVWTGEYEDSKIVKSFKDEQSAKDYCKMISLVDDSARICEQEVSDEKYTAPDYFWVKATAWKSEWKVEGIQTVLQDIFTQKDLENEFAAMWDFNASEGKKILEAQIPTIEMGEGVKIVKHLKYNEYYIYVKISKDSFFDKNEFGLADFRADLYNRANSIAKCLEFGEC